MKTNFVIVISTPMSCLAKLWVSSYGAKCCQPMKLQGSLKCNIWRKKWMINFIFGLQVNIEVFYKVILSFWLCITRHTQSTKNNKLVYLCSISRKAWGMKFDFCLQINTKTFYVLIVSFWVCIGRHARSTQRNKFTISLKYLKETIKDEVDFWLVIIVKAFFKVILSF